MSVGFDSETDSECFHCEVTTTTTTSEWLNNTDIIENGTDVLAANWQWPTPLFMIITSSVLGLMILTTIIGNIFVIAAVMYEKNLQNVANYLIVSLAVADLMVACLVMPLGALYEICGTKWILGPVLCDMWTSSDVLCCTASILHLVSIALDRFWAVTDIEYIRSRNKSRINTMILLVWLVAIAVSLAPVLGWKDPQFYIRLEIEKKCLVSQDMGYQIFATCSSFYVPLCVILLLYWKIFQTARRRIRRRPGRTAIKNEKMAVIIPDDGSSRIIDSHPLEETIVQPLQCSGENTDLSNRSLTDITPEGGRKSETIESLLDAEAVTPTTPTPTTPTPINDIEHNITLLNTISSTISISISNKTTTTKRHNSSSNSITTTNENDIEIDHHPTIALATLSPTNLIAPTTIGHSPARQLTTIRKKNKESIEAKRERKAAKTLAIITGAFVVCWLPFFMMALILALCTTCMVPDTVSSAFLWLGYFNSTLNPIIYTLFSPEFRQAFKRILCGRNYHRRRK